MSETPLPDPVPTAEGDLLDSREAGGAVIRGGALRMAGYVGGILIGLIATPFMVRHLGDDEFGRYVTVTSLLFVVTGLTDGGLTAVGVREWTDRSSDGRLDLMRTLLGLRLALFTLGTLVAVLFAVAAGYDTTLVAGTAIACSGLLFAHIAGAAMVPLTGQLRQGALAWLDLVRQIVIAVGSLALVVAGAVLLPFFTLAPLAALIGAVASIAVARRDMPLRPHVDWQRWRELLTASVPFAIATAFAVMYFRVPILLLSITADDRETSFFGLAFRVVEIATGVPYLLVFAAFPILVRAAGTGDDARLRYALQRMFEVALILGALAALSIGLIAPFAIDVLGDSDFAPAVTPLVVLGTALIGTFLVSTWSYALLTLGHNRVLIYGNAVAVLVGGGATLALAPSLGALGAAIATAGTEIGLGVVYGVVLARRHPELTPELGVVPKLLVASAAGVGVPVLTGLSSVPATAVGVVLFAGLAVALKAIPQEVFEQVRRGRA